MCTGKLKTSRWILGLIVLALFAFTGQTAYAAACTGIEIVSLGGGLTLGQATIHMGSSYTTGGGVFTNNSTCDTGGGAVGENVTLSPTVILVPACTVNPSPGTTCASPDTGVITVTAATSAAGTCGASLITWVVTGSGSFTLTAPGGIALAAGASCSIHFSYTVNTLPTQDANTATINVLDTGGSIAGSAQADSGESAGGIGTTDTPFAFTCGVKVDKQISCDGGATWSDAAGFESANNDGSNGCVGTPGLAGVAGVSGILTRYAAQNISDSGIALASCTIGESNVKLGTGITTTFGITNNGTSGGPSTQSSGFSLTGEPSTPLECMAATPGSEPDTATVSCTCEVPLLTPPTVTATDGATFGCCGVAVDKQVSCNNGPFTDVGFETADQDGLNGCSAINGQPVAIQYAIQNTGNLSLTCSGTSVVDPLVTLGLVDKFIVNAGTAFALTGEGPFAGGATSSFIQNTSITSCSSTLNTNEATGDKAQVDCTCTLPTPTPVNVPVSAFDTAQITCGSPSFNVSKTCIPATPGNFNVDVKVDNTGTVPLSCQITDNFFTGVCTTPPIAGTPAGSVSVSPDPLTPNGGITADALGSFSSAVTVCNEAAVACTPTGGTVLPTQYAEALCPVGNGCFTRTPGYWGTHPIQTQDVLNLNGGLASCGITLTDTSAPTTSASAIEDLCGTGGRDFKANGTTPQQLQLIRQCTAAALNLAASANPSSQLDCEAADPGITAQFNSCCTGPTSTCDSGASSSVIDTSACITVLDAFNNQFDNTNFPSWLTNSPAQPRTCQIANGDGLVNSGRNLGKK